MCSVMQCGPRGSRQHNIRKNFVQSFLNTIGTTWHMQNPMQCCPRDSRQHCTGKNPGNVV